MFQLNTELVHATAARVNSFGAWNGQFTKKFPLPHTLEPWQTGFTPEKLLHGGLLEVALLGEELLQSIDQFINITQRPRNSTLLGCRR